MTKTLGPQATYRNLDGSAKRVTVAGVTFTDGKPINVIAELGDKRGAELLQKLAGNHFFDVEGSKADHSDIRDRVGDASGDEPEPAPKANVRKSVAKRIAKEDQDDESVGTERPPKTDPAPEPHQTEELPDDVKTPDAPQLENPGASRRPRLQRARDTN